VVAKLGSSHSPDAAVVIDVLDITARMGGNLRHGLFVRATGR
jgi:hypothetical protein